MAGDLTISAGTNNLQDIARQCNHIINDIGRHGAFIAVYREVTVRGYRGRRSVLPRGSTHGKAVWMKAVRGHACVTTASTSCDAHDDNDAVGIPKCCERLQPKADVLRDGSDEPHCRETSPRAPISADLDRIGVTAVNIIMNCDRLRKRVSDSVLLADASWETASGGSDIDANWSLRLEAAGADGISRHLEETPRCSAPVQHSSLTLHRGDRDHTYRDDRLTDVTSIDTMETADRLEPDPRVTTDEEMKTGPVGGRTPNAPRDRRLAKQFRKVRSYSEIGASELERQTNLSADGERRNNAKSAHLSLGGEYSDVAEQVVVNIREKRTPQYVYITGTVENQRPTVSPAVTSPGNGASSPGDEAAAATRLFDIVGPRSNSRFPWQKDIGVQCSLLLSPPAAPTARCRRGLRQYLSVDSASRADHCCPAQQGPRSAGHSAACPPPAADTTPAADTPLCRKQHRRKKRTESVVAGGAKPDPCVLRRHASAICRTSRSEDYLSSTDDIPGAGDVTRQGSADSGLAGRLDTLPSPQLSRVPWYKTSVPDVLVTPLRSPHDLKSFKDAANVQIDQYLTVPGRAWRRSGSGSVHSASEESDQEPSPPRSRRGRRQAIFDPKSLGLVSAPDGDASPSNSCDEADGNSSCNSATSERCCRKRSSADLGVTYTGDLLIRRHHKKVLIKRNTIADFAVNKSYQSLTASLATEQDSKKLKGTFSLLKLIDKKSHKAKDSTTLLADVLQSLKPSEFKDTHITCYKDVHWSELIPRKEEDAEVPVLSEMERKRREAVWELFKSECVFLVDHIMVLKHCFMEPMKKVQVEGHLMFAEPQDIFGNLDELCYVSYTFCRDFISSLLKGSDDVDFGSTAVVSNALQRLSQLTRDGEVYHEYCLNYSKAILYLEQLRKNDDFCEFEKYCEQDSRCHRLQLTDLLISPMHRCTKVPLLLNKIRKYTENPDEKQHLTASLEKLAASLKSLEVKMKWLTNFERVQEIQQQVIWQPIMELEPRAFIPEFLRAKLSRQPCERLLASPRRQLLHEGPLTLLEVSKTIDMYMFLFDDIMLLTRVKKPPRKKLSDPSQRIHTDGAVFIVHKQPIALDRFTVHDIRPPDATVNGLKNAFVLVQISRFQQIIGVFTLQAPTESAKTTWLNQLHEAQYHYKASVSAADSHAKSLQSEDSFSVSRSVEVEVSISAPDDDDDSGSAVSSRRSSSASKSRHHRVSCDSFESHATHTTNVTSSSSSSDESISDRGSTAVPAVDVSPKLLSTRIDPWSGTTRMTEAILSPRTERLRRLNAIHEKSQSLDAIYI